MNWLVLALLAWLLWGICDIVLKLCSAKDSARRACQISIQLGICGFILAVVATSIAGGVCSLPGLLARHWGYALVALITTGCMFVSNIGIRYLDMSIMSPIENASGFLPPIVLACIYCISGRLDLLLDTPAVKYGGAFLVIVGAVMLGIEERRLPGTKPQRERRTMHIGPVALLFPLAFCIADAADTIVSSLAMDGADGADPLEIMAVYGMVLAVFGLACSIAHVAIWKKLYNPVARGESCAAISGVLECTAYATFLLALNDNPIFAPVVVGSYCMLTVLLSNLILGEKLKRLQYLAVALVISGIVMMEIADV
ncbi:MAG: EamA family transporter [Victivallaceae bacterium]|nr:EamA family transporter [Victivallaceae bacterium]